MIRQRLTIVVTATLVLIILVTLSNLKSISYWYLGILVFLVIASAVILRDELTKRPSILVSREPIKIPSKKLLYFLLNIVERRGFVKYTDLKYELDVDEETLNAALRILEKHKAVAVHHPPKGFPVIKKGVRIHELRNQLQGKIPAEKPGGEIPELKRESHEVFEYLREARRKRQLDQPK